MLVLVDIESHSQWGGPISQPYNFHSAPHNWNLVSIEMRHLITISHTGSGPLLLSVVEGFYGNTEGVSQLFEWETKWAGVNVNTDNVNPVSVHLFNWNDFYIKIKSHFLWSMFFHLSVPSSSEVENETVIILKNRSLQKINFCLTKGWLAGVFPGLTGSGHCQIICLT